MADIKKLFIPVGMWGGNKSYIERLKRVIGAALYRYYPMNEPIGTLLAQDKSINSAHAAYSTSAPPTLGETGWGDGNSCVYFPATSFLNLYSTAFLSGLNKNEFSCGFVFKPPARSYYQNGVNHFLCNFRVSNNDQIFVQANGISKYIKVSYTAGGIEKALSWYGDVDGAVQITLTVSKSNDRANVYICGIPIGAELTGLGDFTATPLGSEYCVIGNYRTLTDIPALGSIQHWFWANRELSASEVERISSPVSEFMPTANVLILGDSKSLTANGLVSWSEKLHDIVYVDKHASLKYYPSRISITSLTTYLMQDRCDADIAAMVGTPDIIIYNLGANDTNNAIVSGVWDVDTCYTLDAYHTAFPNARVYMTKIWRRNVTVEAARIAEMNALIDTAVLPGREAWLSVGINEGDILPGADDGATNTADGVHLSEAGCYVEAAAWKTALGY